MKAEVPMIEQVVGAMAGNASALQSAAATAILVARYIYQKITELPVYTPKELENYRELTSLYREYVDSKIPDEWELEVKDGKAKGSRPEHRPMHDHDFEGQGQRLITDLARLRINTVRIDESASVMLSQIAALFDSLSKRRVAPLRRGSVEGMFFTELSHWILQKLPLMDFKTQRDLKKIINIRDYCQKVSARVLTPDDVPGRNNPISVLELIINNLNGIIKATEELILLSTFNDRVERLDNAIAGMTSKTFHMMYLMIQGEHDHETRLPVDLFLDEGQRHRPKIQTFKKQRLAHWLQETLVRLGIKRADFRADLMIDLSEMDAHLEGECYGDRHLVLPPELVDKPNHKNWGHWNFLIENHRSIREAPVPVKNSEEMATILRKTREVYRSILKIYYLQRFLTNLRQVAPTYGEVWLYGDSTGRTVVEEVLTMATEFSRGLMESVSRLFEQDIHKHFIAKVRASSIGAEEQGFIAMREAASLYTGVNEYFEQAQEEVRVIRTQAGEYESRLAKAAVSKKAVLEDLIQFLEYRGRQRTPVYDALKSALDALSGSPTAARAAPVVGTATAEEAGVFQETRTPQAQAQQAEVPPAQTQPQSGEPMRTTPEQSSAAAVLSAPEPVAKIYPAEKMQVALQLQTSFRAPVQDTRVDRFNGLILSDTQVSRLDPHQRNIYRLVLQNYNGIANSRARSFFLLYSQAQWDLLRKHLFRMNDALDRVVGERSSPADEAHEDKMRFINTFLSEGLKQLFTDFCRIKEAADLYVAGPPPVRVTLEDMGDGHVRVVSAEIAIHKLEGKFEDFKRAAGEKEAVHAAEKAAHASELAAMEQRRIADSAAAEQRRIADIAALKAELSTQREELMAQMRAMAAQFSARSPSPVRGVAAEPVAPEAATVGGPGLFHAPVPVAAPPQESAEVTSDAATSKKLKRSAKGTCSVM